MSETILLKLNFHDKNFSYIKNIRKIVFSEEIGISESELFDKYDETCDHFLIFDEKNIVGSVRVILIEPQIKIERMVILKNFRLKNHGKNCILQIIDYYHSKGYSQVILDSIYSISKFYKKCGFIEEGIIFQRVGIDHIRMTLTL